MTIFLGLVIKKRINTNEIFNGVDALFYHNLSREGHFERSEKSQTSFTYFFKNFDFPTINPSSSIKFTKYTPAGRTDTSI